MVKVFAPVNIAWIKYMGKHSGLPTNASFSMTLDQLGTETSIRKISDSGELSFIYSSEGYVPPLKGQEKSFKFLSTLRPWDECLNRFQLERRISSGVFEIKTQNNIPAGTGIASSASGFAALTLAWMGILVGEQLQTLNARYEEDPVFRAEIAKISSLGSGSACRSFGGPFVEWDPHSGVKDFSPHSLRFTDFVLLIESSTKDVSSSEAHERVKTSPLFLGRVERAKERLIQVKDALIRSEVSRLSSVVFDEAMDMHELFHTSQPSFSYWRPKSIDWINRVKDHQSTLPSPNVILTLDAGANVHLFVPEAEEGLWESFIAAVDPDLKWLKARAGRGAHFHV